MSTWKQIKIDQTKHTTLSNQITIERQNIIWIGICICMYNSQYLLKSNFLVFDWNKDQIDCILKSVLHAPLEGLPKVDDLLSLMQWFLRLEK